jgi:hypothetical protein
MPFYQVDNAGGAWTHALHIHADEINDDGNGPTSRTPARMPARRASSYRVTALPRYRGTPRPPANPRVGYGTRGRRLSEATDTGKS